MPTAADNNPQVSAADWTAITPLLQAWSEKAHDHEKTNYEAAHVYRKRYSQLGIPLVILTAVVGTGIFGTLEKSASVAWRVAVGVLSVLTTILTAIQTFLRYGEKAEKHRNVAVRYGEIRRDIDLTLALPPALRGDAKKFLETIKAQLDAIEADAPEIDRAIYDLAHSYDADGAKKAKKEKKLDHSGDTARNEPRDQIFG